MIRKACFHPVPDYKPPTYKEVREFIAKHGLTVSDYAELVGVGSRAARYWCSAVEDGGRQIPYSAWRLSLIVLGEVEP